MIKRLNSDSSVSNPILTIEKPNLIVVPRKQSDFVSRHRQEDIFTLKSGQAVLARVLEDDADHPVGERVQRLY